MSGTQFQKAKEDAAAIMREKQRKGMYHLPRFVVLVRARTQTNSLPPPADEKRAAEAAGGKKK